MEKPEQWSFLTSWCDVLKECVNYMGNECSGSSFMERSLYIELPMRDQSERFTQGVDLTSLSDTDHEDLFRKQLQKSREAMALVAAVAHVDYAAWRYLLEKHCSVNFGVEGEPVYEKKIPVRYVVALELKDHTWGVGTHESDLVFFFGVHQRLHPSGEYREALQQIAALDKNPLRSKSDFDFDVPVRVDFDGAYGMNELVDVGIAEKIVQQQWQKYEVSGESQSTARGEWRCTFVLERMIVDLVDHDTTTAMGAALKTLLHQNTWFSLISLCRMRHLMMPAQCYGQLVSSVFDSTRRSPQLARTTCHPSFVPASGSSDPLQLGEIVVTWAPDVHIHYVGAMCSAMVHNQMSKNLSLRLQMNTDNGEINQRYWKWLGYALFSKRARSSSAVESLAMMKVCSMSVSDMEAFTSIASSDHPEEDLFGLSPGLVNSREATLKGGTLIRCVLDGWDESADIVAFEAAILCVQTFSDDGSSAWVDSIVPGYGRCQVQRCDLVFDSDNATPPRDEGISSLRLQFNKVTPSISDGLIPFFRAIGFSLRYLTLDAPRRELPTILGYCPNLVELSLCGGVVDARLNFSVYHAKGESLPQFNPNWDSVSAIATTLADNDNSLTKCTRRIRVRIEQFSDEVDSSVPPLEYERRVRADFSALLDMLKTNRSLEYLEVAVPPVYERYLQSFRSHHLEPIWRTLNPLPLGSKLAFLSICTLGSEPSVKRPDRAEARSRIVPSPLDLHVLTIIFEFAADPVLREVYFRTSRHIRFELEHDETSI